MCWPSFSIGFGAASTLAAFAWMIASAAREVRERLAMIAAHEAEQKKGDR